MAVNWVVFIVLQADDVWHRIAFQWELATAGVMELLQLQSFSCTAPSAVPEE